MNIKNKQSCAAPVKGESRLAITIVTIQEGVNGWIARICGRNIPRCAERKFFKRMFESGTTIVWPVLFEHEHRQAV